MMKTLRKLNEGSLLQRTLLHIAVFVLGSASVVTLASVLLVSTAKAVLPSHDTTEADADADADKADQEEKGSDTDSSSPEAAAGAAGAQGKPRALARLGSRRESAVAR
ncbi:hypothetical protein [Sorangium sp. So ce1335]|uniref:hypothetical protein n=1 Tax=Sorangium sp. So ce1335 TaxID=3133335 RepID=UPI003F6088F7